MNTYDLTKLSPQAFEHLVNQLAIRVLGQGHSTFGPGSDGGRDGLFEGKAPYPSETDQWSGTWYIQSKFHAPHVSADAQKWLLGEIKKELEGFKAASTRRVWPDIWIVATNIDPSGVPQTGAFDKGRSLVKTVRTKLASRFHIWGGKKILDLLAQYPDVVAYFRHFLTPGHVLTEMLDQLTDIRASADRVIRYLVVTQFEEYQYTKLEQAGSLADTRPGIHKLFIDVPFTDSKQQVSGLTLHYLVNATSQSHRHDAATSRTEDWNLWSRHPARVGIWFVRGGPGRGKSTVGQYFSQIQRAALILQNSPPYQMKPGLKAVVEDLATTARKQGFFPESPRIPILVDLKDYSAWLGKRLENQPIGVISYIADRLTTILEQPVLTGLLIRMMTLRSWFIAFDGLDEVPHDVKDTVATQVCNFLENVAIEHNFDVFALCTSRPQGYSGQFSDLYAATLDLINLSREQALACAKPVLEMERSLKESSEAYDRLYQASVSDTIQQLMTTPLQSHIMAIIVRDGEEPPDRRWLLFRTFYNVIKRRESNKKFPDPRLAKLLREDDRLLKTIHNRLGFALQARAEESVGAESFLTKDEFEKLVRNAVGRLLETDVESTVQVLLRATTERLVLVSTPEAGSQIRFDVRQLQEFFAGEFIYESVDAGTLQRRLEAVSRDSHWREVVQFCISALIEAERTTEIAIANQVLVGLNSSGEDESKDVVARMLGRGSIISARLLAEGVLEQDKRTRHQFAVSLEPFLATTNMSDIAQLVQTARPNSRTWLLEYLRNALTIRTNAENVGAALSLSLMLGDDDPLIEFVKRHLLNASMEYSAFVVTLAVLHTRTRSIAKGEIHSWRDREARGFFFAEQRDAVFLVGLQAKARRGGDDAFDGAQFFGNEGGDFLERVAFHHHEQIVAAGHQVAALHFRKTRDAIRQPVETAAALGRDFHLDQRRHDRCRALLRIDDRLVAEDHARFLHLRDLRGDDCLRAIEFAREIGGRGARILAQELEQFVHEVFWKKEPDYYDTRPGVQGRRRNRAEAGCD